MARKFGQRVEVSTNMSDYMIGIMAPSGFGKTTLMYQVCEKEFGPDGYIILDAGHENGVAALQGAVAEKTPTWKKVKEVIDDIVKNKDTDYAALKVVIFDTLDATFEIAENYTIREWNAAHLGEKDFKPASSINSVEGGFGRGMDAVINNVKKEVKKLQDAGVGVWWTAHVKEKDQSDLYSGATYTTLTANMAMKYFNSIKNSSHVIAFGYFDRSIETTQVGDENPITKKKKTRNAVMTEARKVKFRDDALVADAKSRFSTITDEIVLGADDFIKAIKDAIIAERKKNAVIGTGKATSVGTVTKPAPPVVVEDAPVMANTDVADESDDLDDIAPFDLDDEQDTVNVEALVADIRDKFKKTTDTAKKAKVKETLNAAGATKLADTLPIPVLQQILEILN